jgi:arylsulfatase A-like enzyme
VRTLPAENLRDHYRAEVYEADRFLGTLLSTLDQLKLSDETIVALTADHGEYLGEHGGFVDHHQLFDQVLHVPMILRWKALEGGQRRTVPVSTIDLAPTLVEALGVEPLPGAQGRSLLDPGAEELPVFAEWRHFHMLEKDAKPRPNDFLVMVQKGTRKYVHDVLFPEKSAFYDLLVDPAETEDRSPSDEGAARELKALLELHLHKDLPRGLLGVDEIHIDEQSLEMLRSLGYVE